MKRTKKILQMFLVGTVISMNSTGGVYAAEDTAGTDKTVNVNSEIDTYALADVVVTGYREKSGYPGGQVVRQSNIGNLGNVDFMDIPMNTLAVSRKTIDENSYPGDTLSQVVTLDPSVLSRGSNTYNDILIRGYYVSPHDFYLNGIPGLLSQSSIPMNFVEDVEVISGPSTLFNGISTSGSVGGSINLVPKSAGENPVTRITETFSGKGNLENAIDIGRRFGKDHAWGIRINADYAKGNTERNNEKMERENLFINLDHRDKNSKTSLLYGYRMVDQYAPDLPLELGKYDVPEPPDGQANFQLPWSHYSYNNHILALSHEQNLGAHWRWFLKGGYHDEDWNHCMESYWPELTDNQGNFSASLEEVPIRFWRRTVAAGVRGSVQTGTLKHAIVFSGDKLWQTGKGADWFPDNTYTGNIYDNSIATHPNDAVVQLGNWYYSGDLTVSGISLIDRISTADDRWILLAGLRHQTVEASSSWSNGHYAKHGSRTATTPGFGIMYKPNKSLAFYANYLEGLSKGSFVSSRYANKNEYLEPQRTKQYEVGVKWDYGDLAAILSAFQVEQENAYADSTTNIYGYYGKQKNQGIQLNVFGKLGKKWNVLGGIMYLNPKQEGGVNDGKSIYGLPKWHATLAVEYVCDSKFSLTGRMLCSGSSYANSVNTKTISGWGRFDFGMKYKTMWEKTPVTLGVTIYNVFNKHYWYSGGQNAVYLGGPRTAVLSASFDL